MCEDYAAIACPVFAVGGWADGYRNAIPRLLAGLRAPSRGLIGPWGHAYPHDGAPGPSIGFLQEALRWWRRWLDGEGHGRRRSSRATASGCPRACRAGFQRRGSARPLGRRGRLALRAHRNRATCASRPAASAGRPRRAVSHRFAPDRRAAPPAAGWSTRLRDQREDDALSLCFDSEPLVRAHRDPRSTRSERWSSPRTGPSPFVVARLCDVAPDGRVTRVSYGMLNLTHRAGHEAWEPLVPGQAGRGDRPPERRGLRLPARPPPAARALERLLAARLALAGTGPAHALTEASLLACPCAHPIRATRTCAPSSHRSARGRRSGRRSPAGDTSATRKSIPRAATT